MIYKDYLKIANSKCGPKFGESDIFIADNCNQN